ncbi:MAG TPA: MFS transporter [Arthrobacter sp.]|nr:MFS transporter [Arthrobacter sp.]
MNTTPQDAAATSAFTHADTLQSTVDPEASSVAATIHGTPAAPRRSRLPGRFARLPELAGSGFLPLGLFARLPLAMLTVGTLTLVTAVSHSYAIGGMAAGAVGIGSAVGAPILGSLADRLGQRSILLVAAALNTAMVVALLLAAYLTPGFDAPTDPVATLLAAFLAGASCPQVGPMARVRWMGLTTRNLTRNASAGPGNDAGRPAPGPLGPAAHSVAGSRADLDTALSYEGTADEITFVLGPALVGLLASLFAPWLPLALAAALTATLVPAFAVHPSHLAVVPPRRKATAAVGHVQGGTKPGVRSRALAKVAVPVLAMVCMGTFFGATQNALSAFSAQFATAEIAGLMYSVVGLSSAVAALSVAYWPRRFGFAARWVAAAALMTASSLLLFLPSGIWPMVGVLLVLGIPVGPVMVTVFSIGGIVAPDGRLATVMTALASGIVAGTALGAYLAGQLAQAQGPAAAFAVSCAASASLLVLGIVAGLILGHKKA